MNIPDKIKILGHEYAVIKEPHLYKKADFGTCCPNLLEIRIDSTFPESHQAHAFMHEVFEVIKWHINSDMSHELLSQLSEILFSIIRNNNLDFGLGR